MLIERRSINTKKIYRKVKRAYGWFRKLTMNFVQPVDDRQHSVWYDGVVVEGTVGKHIFKVKAHGAVSLTVYDVFRAIINRELSTIRLPETATGKDFREKLTFYFEDDDAVEASVVDSNVEWDTWNVWIVELYSADNSDTPVATEQLNSHLLSEALMELPEIFNELKL